MKTLKVKKLSLSKVTVADLLDKNQMNKIVTAGLNIGKTFENNSNCVCMTD